MSRQRHQLKSDHRGKFERDSAAKPDGVARLCHSCTSKLQIQQNIENHMTLKQVQSVSQQSLRDSFHMHSLESGKGILLPISTGAESGTVRQPRDTMGTTTKNVKRQSTPERHHGHDRQKRDETTHTTRHHGNVPPKTS